MFIEATHQHVEHSCVPFALSLIHVLAVMLDRATKVKNDRTEPISYTELPNAIYVSKYEKNTKLSPTNFYYPLSVLSRGSIGTATQLLSPLTWYILF